MPSIQDNYADNIPLAYAGQIANMAPATLISRTVEDAASIGLGLPVYQGSNDYGCTATASGDVVGITVLERSLNPETPNSFAQYESARLMTKGTVWVTVGAAVSAGDDVYLAAGEFTADSAATGAVQVANGRFDTSADANGLAIVRLA